MQTQREIYAEKLEKLAPIIVDLIENGESVEIRPSRSGLKLIACKHRFIDAPRYWKHKAEDTQEIHQD